MMRSPDDRSRDASVSEVIVVSSDEEDAEGTESNQRLSDEDLAHRIQVSCTLNKSLFVLSCEIPTHSLLLGQQHYHPQCACC